MRLTIEGNIYSNETASSDAVKPRLVINDPTLSLENELDFNNISVYPNPITDNFYVKGLTNEEATIFVYNTLGQLLKQEVYNNSVDFSSLEVGVYYVKVLNGVKEKIFSIVKK
ncbi:T9SS type A sorting domain-containing protein [Lacinutrix sp. C3R15]|uniref:T9SS type A sorting domain-containing protein n=1 Tax=Flavobacteriaceae TaxID=49546 RepID=UPI001C0A32AA|nr:MULTISPECIES: T9SS type A sorting domain-containing protein [Flavobacteriaceae]MBU2940696.1 T9SS type A sorting domain-containing protein [Lacinutrix sp. C3R15]MDO6624014.1 T9SS type A sorting domain-containing protein [Oceanihabitans sp. 1_MG-2023]